MFSLKALTSSKAVAYPLLAVALFCGRMAFAQTTTEQDKNNPDLLEQRKNRPRNNVKQTNELKNEIKKWTNQDVRWIITDDEMSALKQLSNQEEFDNFDEGAWLLGMQPVAGILDAADLCRREQPPDLWLVFRQQVIGTAAGDKQLRKTSIAKSTIDASLTRTNISRRASLDR